MTNLISLLSGIIFSVGLVISGMINPAKVKGFLDIFGNWDFALVFVMGGAVIFNVFAYFFIFKGKPFLESQFFLPTKIHVDKKLVIGTAIFGIGWGLTGICPGPGIVNLVNLNLNSVLFVGSMIVGMLIFKKAH